MKPAPPVMRTRMRGMLPVAVREQRQQDVLAGVVTDNVEPLLLGGDGAQIAVSDQDPGLADQRPGDQRAVRPGDAELQPADSVLPASIGNGKSSG